MSEVLDTGARLAVLVFVVASMAGAGLGRMAAAVAESLRPAGSGAVEANFYTVLSARDALP